jgi:hypothetical protein
VTGRIMGNDDKSPMWKAGQKDWDRIAMYGTAP